MVTVFAMTLTTLDSVADKLLTVGTAGALGADSSMDSHADSETAGSGWVGISLPAQGGGGITLGRFC